MNKLQENLWCGYKVVLKLYKHSTLLPSSFGHTNLRLRWHFFYRVLDALEEGMGKGREGHHVLPWQWGSEGSNQVHYGREKIEWI